MALRIKYSNFSLVCTNNKLFIKISKKKLKQQIKFDNNASFKFKTNHTNFLSKKK